MTEALVPGQPVDLFARAVGDVGLVLVHGRKFIDARDVQGTASRGHAPSRV